MYDDLVNRLRSEAVYLPEKFSKNAELLDVLMKAADAIEELSRLHEAQRQNLIALMNEEPETEWIPAAERLPERQDEYLVLWRAKGFRAAGLFYAILEFDPGEESWVDDLPQAAAVGGFEVEYWMPLPGLPEEEETEADG